MTTLQNIIQLLSADQYTSGQKIADKLGVAKSTVWNMIKQLKELGVDVYSSNKRGYKLVEPVSLLDEALLNKSLSAKFSIASNVVFSIESTNKAMLNAPFQTRFPYMLLASEIQTAGRGRRGKEWQAKAFGNLTFSLTAFYKQGLPDISDFSLKVGMAVASYLNQQGLNAQVKWPNDVYVSGKKIAGILIELNGSFEDECRVVVGVGLNVNLSDDDLIDQPWTSMSKELKKHINRTEVCTDLVESIINTIEQPFDHGLWDKLDYLTQKPVTVLKGEQSIKGKAVGINEQANLLVELPSGEVQSFNGGEVSVRK